MKQEPTQGGLTLSTPPRRRRRRRGLLILISLPLIAVALYAAGGVYGVPWLVARWLGAYASEAPAGLAAADAVRFNPFTLVAEIEGLEIRNPGAGAAISAERVSINFDAASLLERRPVASTVAVLRPEITLTSATDLSVLGLRIRSAALRHARIDRLVIADGSVATGNSGDDALTLERIGIALGEFDGRADAPGRFTLEAETANGARLDSDGTLLPDLDAASGRMRLEGVELAAFASRLGDPIAAVRPTGRLDISGPFSASALLSAPAVTLSEARLTLADLSLTPAAGISVTAAGIAGDAELMLTGNDGKLGLSGRIAVDETELAIRDAVATPPQSFVLTDAVMLATSEPGDEGLTINLGGRLVGAGDTTLTVRAPSTQSGATRVAFRVAELATPTLSIYSSALLGRAVAAGTADLDIEYLLSDQRVDGNLQLVARGLEFGDTRGATDSIEATEVVEAIDTSNAIDAGLTELPSLELAAALLENAAGVVEIELPFAGNALSTRDAVAAALRARLAALTETPFDALAPLIADEAGTARAMPFQPGDAALNDRATASIEQLVRALNERPRLGLRIHGAYDAVADREALARQQIQLHVQLATAGPSGQARPVDFGSPREQDVLDEFAGQRLDAARVASLKERFECVGAVAQLCRRAYYELIFDALVENEEISPTALNRLGRFRATSIADALRQRGIAEDRIAVVTGNDAVDSLFGVGLRVELTAAALL